MKAATEKPTLLVLHYQNGSRYRDSLVDVPTRDLEVVDVVMPNVRFDSSQAAMQAQQEFRDWVTTLPNAVIRAIVKDLSEDSSGLPVQAWRFHVLNNKLHQRRTASDPPSPFVVKFYEGSEYSVPAYLPGSANVEVTHINVSDLRTTTRVSHHRAVQAAKDLPFSLQVALAERMQGWRTALRPAIKAQAEKSLS